MPGSDVSSDRPHLCLFGPFRLTGCDGSPVIVSSRRARALLVYLSLEGAHGASRERLGGLLWSDRGEAQARASLRQCLLELRQSLADGAPDLIQIGREHVTLRPGALRTDLEALERALAGKDLGGLQAVLGAVGPAPLFEDAAIGGLFGDWLGQTRTRLDERIAAGVHICLEEQEAAGNWAQVRALAQAYLHRDPLDETVVAAAMRADAASGSASAAHRRFQVLASALAKEFGVAPGAAARDALASVSTTGRKSEAPAAPAPNEPAPAEGPPFVVVAAFETGDPGSAESHLAGTLRDEVVSGLSRFRDFRVITDPQPLNAVSADTAAQRSVAYVLGASLRTSGEGARLTVQLMRIGDRRVIWSDQFPLRAADAATTIDGIIAEVVGAVLPTIDADLAQQAGVKPTNRTYERYLLASDASFDAKTFEQASNAATALEALVKTEPAFPLPYLPLARLYNTDFNYTRAGSSGAKQRAEALRLAKLALTLDRGHVHGYTVTGWCYLRSRLWEPARIHLDQALALNPFHATRTMEVGFGLVFLGDLERARALLDRCLLLNPAPEDDFFIDLGLLELVRGDHDRAASYFELVAQPTLWSDVYGAINAALSGANSDEKAGAARARIQSIWPKTGPAADEDVVAWIAAHHPFRQDEAEARFLNGARRMLAA